MICIGVTEFDTAILQKHTGSEQRRNNIGETKC